jgi:hypothetical protein
MDREHRFRLLMAFLGRQVDYAMSLSSMVKRRKVIVATALPNAPELIRRQSKTILI